MIVLFSDLYRQKKGKNGPKTGNYKIGQNNFASCQKFNLAMISKPKILEFFHTMRKTWQIDVQRGIGPIKVRPYFDRPNPTLNVKLASFPQSMIKFKYFQLRNHCQIEFLMWGKLEFYDLVKWVFILNTYLREKKSYF